MEWAKNSELMEERSLLNTILREYGRLDEVDVAFIDDPNFKLQLKTHS